LKGPLINEAYFIGPKKYGYYIIDPVTGVRKEFSVLLLRRVFQETV
jgi:hypothetical protein